MGFNDGFLFDFPAQRLDKGFVKGKYFGTGTFECWWAMPTLWPVLLYFAKKCKCICFKIKSIIRKMNRKYLKQSEITFINCF